jgi:hypothetical protein
MPFEDDKNKELLTSLGLTLAGGVGTGVSAGLESWLTDKINLLDDWDKKTEALREFKPYKSELTGNWLQTSPEMADKLLDNYVINAKELATTKMGPWRAGNVVGNIRLLPFHWEKLTKGTTTDRLPGLVEHYKLFSDPNSTKEMLKTHMIDTTRTTDLLDQSYVDEMREAFQALPEDIKKIIDNPTTGIADKYKALADTKHAGGISYLEDYVLGRGTHPGTAKVVGGGIIGKVDDAGKVTQEVLHPGYSRNYTYFINPKFKLLRTLNRLKLGGGAALTGIGLFGLGKQLADSGLLKTASLKDIDWEQVGGSAEAAAGGALTSLGAFKTSEKLKQLLDDLHADPNMNVGFSYGAYKGVGDGHKTPANNIRQILEKYVDSLPDGHELKGTALLDDAGNPILNELGFKKRKGGIQFLDLGNFEHGIGPGVGKDLNMLYNTGMGIAVPNFMWSVGHPLYGNPTAEKNKKMVQSLRNYMTDTPYTVKFGPLDVPSFGAAVVTPKSGIFGLNGHGYDISDVATLGYGNIPEGHQLAHKLLPVFGGRLINIAPDISGTPLINPATLNRMNDAPTRESAIEAFDALVKKKKAAGQDVSALQDILDSVKRGDRLITLAGAGRGDYGAGKTSHMLAALDRVGADNVKVVSMLGSYTGADLPQEVRDEMVNKIKGMDGPDSKRLTVFGRLDNDLYTTLQRMSHANVGATGQMGISEMANAGNLQYIPEKWQDMKRKNDFDVQGLMQSPPEMRRWLNNKWADLAGITDPAQREKFIKNFDNLHPVLDFWNKGSKERMPKDLPDVFKTYGAYEGELWPEVRKYLKNIGLSDATIDMNPQRFDMTDIAKLMLPENAEELSRLTTLAESAAAKNRDLIPQAQKALIDDMVSTVQKNVRRQKFKALPGLAGGALGTGLGIFGMVDGIKRTAEAAKPKFNIKNLFS